MLTDLSYSAHDRGSRKGAAGFEAGLFMFLPDAAHFGDSGHVIGRR